MNSADLHQAIYDRVNSVLVDDGNWLLFGGRWDDTRRWDDTKRWVEVLVPQPVDATYYIAPQADDSGSETPFPYITVGPYTFTPNDTKTENGQTVLVDVHLWHREPSPLIWMAMQTSIYDTLQKYAMTVSGLTIVDCRFDGSVDVPDPDGITGHVANTFRVTYFEE